MIYGGQADPSPIEDLGRVREDCAEHVIRGLVKSGKFKWLQIWRKGRVRNECQFSWSGGAVYRWKSGKPAGEVAL